MISAMLEIENAMQLVRVAVIVNGFHPLLGKGLSSSLLNQLLVLQWVIVYISYLWRQGEKITTGDIEQMAHLWLSWTSHITINLLKNLDGNSVSCENWLITFD